MPQKVVLASGNAGKLIEFRHDLGDYLDLVSQADLGITAADETGLSFVENALLKARHVSKLSGLAALADDSGLCVNALNGLPGIYSARFAGPDATDLDNNNKLLELLGDKPEQDRLAHFVCVLVYLHHANDPEPLICEASWQGRILNEPRGENGFGYDPLFFSPDQGCASAELPLQIKNRVSHRGQAIAILKKRLDEQK
jgi:XTP/dITP diphosphohydrolase